MYLSIILSTNEKSLHMWINLKTNRQMLTQWHFNENDWRQILFIDVAFDLVSKSSDCQWQSPSAIHFGSRRFRKRTSRWTTARHCTQGEYLFRLKNEIESIIIEEEEKKRSRLSFVFGHHVKEKNISLFSHEIKLNKI